MAKSIFTFQQARIQVWLALLAVGIVALVGYLPILRVSFVGDDWIFYELAGRLSLQDYLVKYFDPRTQTAWYRPVQGVLFRFWYDIFRTDMLGYHLSNVLIHLASALAVFAVMFRALKSMRVALIAALLFASFPTAVEGVFKPGVIDPLTTLFALIAVWFWIGYLRGGKWRDYWFALGSFLISLYSKEIAITLPFTLFLVDRFVVRQSSTLRDLLHRYVWFGIAIALYIPIEVIVVSRSVFVSREGYSTSSYLIFNLLDYLAMLAFPWQLPAPINHVWLALVGLLIGYCILVQRMFGLLPLIANAVLAVLPILPFPFVTYRFLYMSLASTAILIALALEWIGRHSSSRWMAYGLALVLAIVVAMSSAGVSNAAAEFGEFARVARVPFRNVSQAHPTFIDDSLVYFVNPPLPGPNLSGMFFWRYGTRVIVRADDMDMPTRLRDHAVAFVNYFDEQGNQKEVRVEKEMTAQATPQPPLNFAVPIRLDGYELASTTVKRDQAIVLFLYWHALDRTPNDYATHVQLVDSQGQARASYEHEPRQGKSHTSSWITGQRVLDAIVLPVGSAPAGSYQLRVALYDSGAQKPIAIVDASGRAMGDAVVIAPLSIVE